MDHPADIDKLIQDMVKKEGLKSPSNAFAGKVMHTITKMDVKAAPFKPLIPRYVLITIFSGVGLILFFLFTGNSQAAGNYSFYLHKILNSFRVFQFDLAMPAQVSYMITSALILLMIQAALIGTIYKKNHR